MPFNFRELKKGDEIICTYVGYLKSVGIFKRPVFVFRDEKKKQFHLWGSVLLNSGLWGVPFRSKLKITFRGMIAGQNTARKLKGYEIEVLGDEKVTTPHKPTKTRPRRV
jgi:hypothetical protein